MSRIKYWDNESGTWKYADNGGGGAGTPGSDGKSAYDYAVEGGYAGTEEQFAVKLAEETPKNTRLARRKTGVSVLIHRIKRQ